MRTITMLCLTLLAALTPLRAATITLDPSSGDIIALPGVPSGWGFTVTNDSSVDTISFTGSVLVNETNPGLGLYIDLIGPQGGPAADATLWPLGTWTEGFSDALQTGVGEFVVDPSAPLGAQDSGLIRVQWDEWAGAPATCNCSPAQFSADLPFQVTVGSVPEPESIWMVALGCSLLIIRLRRKEGRSRTCGVQSV